MTDEPVTDGPEVQTSGGPGRVVGRIATYLITGVLNAIAFLCVLMLWSSWLSGDYRTDHDLLENGGIFLTLIAVAGGGSAVVSLLVTWLAARLGWIPRWVLAIPGVLLMATILATCGMNAITAGPD